MSDKIATLSLNPRQMYSVSINSLGSAIPLYLNSDANVCSATIALTVTRNITSTLVGAPVPTGNLRFIIFAGDKPIETIPLPVLTSEQGLIFTTHALDCKPALIIAAESDVAGDSSIGVQVFINSIGLVLEVCCHGGKKH